MIKIIRGTIRPLVTCITTTQFEMPINTKFRHILQYNLSVLQDELEKLNNSLKIPDGWDEYNRKKAELITSYGLSSMANFDDLSDEEKAKLMSDQNKLNSEYKDVIDKVNKINAEKKPYMAEEIELDLKKMPIDIFPNISQVHTTDHWQRWNLLKIFVDDDI